MSEPTGRSGSSPPAIPMTMTWSNGPAASARRVASRARAGPMPVTSVATDQSPAVPGCENTGSPGAGLQPEGLDDRLELGLHGGEHGDPLGRRGHPFIMAGSFG